MEKMKYNPETGMYNVWWYGTAEEIKRARENFEMTDRSNWSTTVIGGIPVPWKLYGVTENDEKTWLGDFDSEKEITGIANFFANNPHFEHMEIHEGNEFKYAVMRIVGGRHD